MALRRRLRTLVICLFLSVPAAAQSFELFGIRLWGEPAEDERVDVLDPLAYTVTLSVGAAETDLEGTVEGASALWRDRERPASGKAGLISKARGDYRRIIAALYAEGYFGPVISIRVAGAEAADLTLAADIPDGVPVSVTVTPGPRFRFGALEIVNAPPFEEDRNDDDTVDPPSSAGFERGEPALSGAVGRASALSIERWRQLSHAKAQETDREIVADHPSDRVNVRLTLDPGPAVRFGRTTVSGESRLDPDFIAYMASLKPGEPFDPDTVRDAEDRLARLGVFRSFRIEESETVLADGTLPMAISVEDRRRRAIGFGATYSTLDGLGLTAYWLHRNFLGRAERLRFDASIERLLTSVDPSDYRYNLGVSFTRPGTFDPDTSFVASALGRQLDFDAYRETSISARFGLSRQFGRRLKGDIFAEASRARFEDSFGTRKFTTLGFVGRGEYDRRDDPLDATQGYYLAAEARPFYEFDFGNAALQGTVEGRGFLGFGENRRYVLAGRAKLGAFFGPDLAESPPNLLFFAGGGGSIRGYEFRSIGVPITDRNTGDQDVVGGKGLVETSAEFRARFSESFGGVAFVDAGVVTVDPGVSGDTEFRSGVGLGIRYYTPVGPLRVDLATPVDPRPQDNSLAFYIGIGQAF